MSALIILICGVLRHVITIVARCVFDKGRTSRKSTYLPNPLARCLFCYEEVFKFGTQFENGSNLKKNITLPITEIEAFS